jgi:hypothetical protein
MPLVFILTKSMAIDLLSVGLFRLIQFDSADG